MIENKKILEKMLQIRNSGRNYNDRILEAGYPNVYYFLYKEHQEKIDEFENLEKQYENLDRKGVIELMPSTLYAI